MTKIDWDRTEKYTDVEFAAIERNADGDICRDLDAHLIWMTDAQRASVCILHKRHPYGWPLKSMIRDIQPVIGGNGAVALPFGEQYVIIEEDGHRHT